jgi:hypothetical protein
VPRARLAQVGGALPVEVDGGVGHDGEESL